MRLSLAQRTKTKEELVDRKQQMVSNVYLKWFVIAVSIVLLFIVATGVWIPAIIFDTYGKKDQFASVYETTHQEGFTEQRCLHFKKNFATLSIAYSVEYMDIYMGGYAWFNSLSYDRDNLPRDKLHFGLFNLSQPEQQDFFFFDPETEETGMVLVVFNGTTPESVEYFPSNENETFIFHMFARDILTYNYRVFSLFSGGYMNVDVWGSQGYSAAFFKGDLHNWEQKDNLNLDTDEVCHSTLSYSESIRATEGYFIADAITFVNMAILLILVVLFLLFHKSQPTKSRYPLLFCSAIVLLFLFWLQCILLIAAEASYRNKNPEASGKAENGWNFVQNLITLSTALALLIYCCHIGRYYALKYLYSKLARRSDISKNEFTWHRYLTSNTAFILCAFTVLVLLAFMYIPIQVRADKLSSTRFGKNLRLNYAVVVVTEAIVCFVTFLVIAVLVLDFMFNAKAIKEKGLWWFFSFADPLYFRTEMIFFGVFLLIQHVEFIMRSQDIYLLKNLTPFSSRLSYRLKMMYFTYKIFRTFVQWFSCGGITFLIQFYVLFKRYVLRIGYTKSEMKTSELENLLQDEAGYKLMSDYCESEWSTENLACWKYLFAFKQTTIESKDNVLLIYNMFVKAGSEMEVNIPHKVKKELTEMIESQDLPDKIGFDSFQPLYGQVITNLSDTMTRLCQTTEYQSYNNSRKILEKAYKL